MESTSTGPTSGSVLLQQSSLEESAIGGSATESLPRASPIISLPSKTTGRNRSGNSKLNFQFSLLCLRSDHLVTNLKTFSRKVFMLQFFNSPLFLNIGTEFLVEHST